MKERIYLSSPHVSDNVSKAKKK